MTLTRFFNSRYMKIFLCFICIVCLLFGMMVAPPLKAKAVVAIPVVAGIAVVALACIATGALFADSTDMQKVSEFIYQQLDDNLKMQLAELTITGGVVTKIGSDLWNGLVNSVGSFFGTQSLAINTHYLYNPNITATAAPWDTLTVSNASAYKLLDFKAGEEIKVLGKGYVLELSHDTSTNQLVVTFRLSNGAFIQTSKTKSFTTIGIYAQPFLNSSFNNQKSIRIGYGTTSAITFFENDWNVNAPGVYGGLVGPFSFSGGHAYIGGVEVPGFLQPLNNAFSFGLMYDLLYNNAALTYGLDKALVPDLPLVQESDTPLDLPIPTTMDDIATLNPADAIPKVEAPPIPPMPPELPDIDLPSHIFMNKFPFCLPFDLYNAFASLVVTPQAPAFVVPIPLSKVGLRDENITIDLSQYSLLSSISRWAFSIIFIIALILVTRKIIGAQ